MRLLLLFLCALAVYETQSLPEKCYDTIEECHTTNYAEYVKCIRRRQKRSVDCDSPCDSDNCIDTCDDCDCSSCGYTSCQSSCNSCCSTCCNNYNNCNNNHCCHKTCNAQCRTSGCRTSCRKTCYERIRNMDEKTANNITSTSDNKHNITTIIHLNNLINTTNIVDIPINVNNTNHQNITLYQGNAAVNESQSCCIVISPRQCVPQNEPPYIRCFHYRSKQCGEYCSAPIVHKEQRQVCQTVFPGSSPNCHQSIIYIPQPQPRCTYQSTWPYVACGISRSASCAGCYTHYVNFNAQDYINCPSACYDDGFGVGPYYRQGPFYRPTYSHVYGGYGGFSGFQGFGGFQSFGGYQTPYGGYGSYGGYPPSGGYQANGGYPPNGGYSPYGYGGFSSGSGTGFMPYGSWIPQVENNFQQVSNESTPLDPLISVGPNLVNNPMADDPYMASKELEIEVNYEPKSSADAEVKIRNSDDYEEKESDKSVPNNVTKSNPLNSKAA